MKSERRHELQESDLIHALESSKAYLQDHGKSLGLIALAAVALVVVTNVVLSSRRADAENRWRELSLLAFDTNEKALDSFDTLERLSMEAGSDALAIRALTLRGGKALEATTETATPDLKMNEIAKDSFNKLLARYPKNSIASSIARLGMATCAENEFASDGNDSHKAVALEHLNKILNDSSMHTLPAYQAALERKEKIDDVFTTVVFAPPAPKTEEPPPVIDITSGLKKLDGPPPGFENAKPGGVEVVPVTPPTEKQPANDDPDGN
ncbi:MAG: hypothetical protein ACYTHJ_14380 [Planctomycetota bacterium]|jgi:hypothetical protein